MVFIVSDSCSFGDNTLTSELLSVTQYTDVGCLFVIETGVINYVAVCLPECRLCWDRRTIKVWTARVVKLINNLIICYQTRDGDEGRGEKSIFGVNCFIVLSVTIVSYTRQREKW